MNKSLVIRKLKETRVQALIYNEKTKQSVPYRFKVPGWHPDPGGRKLIKAIKKRFMDPDECLIRVESCQLGYCKYELPLSEFIKIAKETHVDADQKDITD